MKTIQIEIPDGYQAKWVNGVLTLVDEQPKDITERIKTFEDACEWCCYNGFGAYVRQHNDIDEVLKKYLAETDKTDILAYLKLRIITCALNEGWEPKFETNEKRYFVCTDYKQEVSVDHECNYCYMPKAIVLKSYELAEYAATQFKDIYMDFCYKGKE